MARRERSVTLGMTRLVLAALLACGDQGVADPASPGASPGDGSGGGTTGDGGGPSGDGSAGEVDGSIPGEAGSNADGGVAAFTRAVVAAGLGNASLAAGNFDALPLLSQTGVFTNFSTMQPNAALVPFSVNTPFWSDGAVKLRWIAVPSDGPPYSLAERIVFDATGNWTFPVGTVTVKHFDLVINEVTGQKKRLETRIGVLTSNGTFAGASYRWRADETDADLISSSVDETNTITTANGTRTQVHTYPSPTQCTVCHYATPGFALGIRTWQLNGSHTYPSGVTGNQLRAWSDAEMFSGPFNVASIPTYLRTVAITDTTATLETRARSYFAGNCSHCHQPGGRNLAWDARYSTPLAQQNIVGNVVYAGDPTGSPLYLRMSYATVDTPARANKMMPPLAKNHVDTFALGVVGQWISGL